MRSAANTARTPESLRQIAVCRLRPRGAGVIATTVVGKFYGGLYEFEEQLPRERSSQRTPPRLIMLLNVEGEHAMLDNESSIRPALGTMQEYRQYLRDITAIQAETVRRLVESDATPPMEMAAVLEDIANKFLDMSDEIRDFALGRPEADPRLSS